MSRIEKRRRKRRQEARLVKRVEFWRAKMAWHLDKVERLEEKIEART